MAVGYCYYCANPIIELGSVQGRVLDVLETWGGWNTITLISDYFKQNGLSVTKKQIQNALARLTVAGAVESRQDPTEMFHPDTGSPVWNTNKAWRYVPPS